MSISKKSVLDTVMKSARNKAKGFPSVPNKPDMTIAKFQGIVTSFLMKTELPVLTAMFWAGEVFPTEDELAEKFAETIYEEGWETVHPSRDDDNIIDLRPGIILENIETLARYAAVRTLEVWTPEWTIAQKAMSIKGGQNSKRPAVFTVEMLAALPKGLSKVQEAEALGCSVAVIGRLRRQMKAAEQNALVVTPELPTRAELFAAALQADEGWYVPGSDPVREQAANGQTSWTWGYGKLGVLSLDATWDDLYELLAA